MATALKEFKIYRTYHGAKNRCDNPNNKDYYNYGGRGIKFLWKSFNDFTKDMYMDYLIHMAIYGEFNTSIERVDNDGDYCKENCKWATLSEQSRNQRPRKRTKFIMLNGKKREFLDVAKEYNIKRNTLWMRLHKYNWPLEKALGKEVRHRNST